MNTLTLKPTPSSQRMKSEGNNLIALIEFAKSVYTDNILIGDDDDKI